MSKSLVYEAKSWYDTPMDIDRITSASPVEIDTELYSLTVQQIETEQRIKRNERLAKSYSDNGRAAQPYLDENIALGDKLITLTIDIEPLTDEFTNRGGWSRFYLVTNGNGHVHRSTHCTTCYMNTSYAWLPELSGKSEDEAVEEFGEKMCTVCFPSAPANPAFRGPGRRDREALAAKAAEKDAKLAAKLEKAILPDGSELRLAGLVSNPKTLIAAQRTLAAEVNSLLWYGESHPMAADWIENIGRLVEAIANKTGQHPDDIREAVYAKQAKKVAKEKAS
jgi:hypothetical protein